MEVVVTIDSDLVKRFHINPERKEGDAVTFSRIGSLYFGNTVTIKTWAANIDDLLLNRINVIENQRDVSVM